MARRPVRPVGQVEVVGRLEDVGRIRGAGLGVTVHGGDALDSSLQPAIDALLPILRAKGLRAGENLVWFRARGALHDEVAWSRRVWRPLEFLFGIQVPRAMVIRSASCSPR